MPCAGDKLCRRNSRVARSPCAWTWRSRKVASTGISFLKTLKAWRVPARLVLLDRDGTLMEEGDYLGDPRRVTLLPGSARGIRDLQRAGFRVVIITNQSAVGRG